MTSIHTICNTCGVEYEGPGVAAGGEVYCCTGCVQGGPCICGGTGILPARTEAAVVTGGNTVVVTEPGTVIAPGDGITTIVR